MSDQDKVDSDASHTEETFGETGFMSHLLELRDRILRMVIAIVVALLGLFPFRNTIYTWLSEPLTKHLPEGSSMIAIDVASTFLAPFKLILMMAIVLVIPYLMHQIWAFIAPGLYKHEKRLAVPLAISSTVLFYLGMLFAYFVVFPLVFYFFTSVAPEGVQVMTDINRYLDFVIKLFLAFGFSFEVPIATFLLVSVGVTSVEKLKKSRPYVFVGAFVLGMLLTPPDIISQIMLAVPIWLLFELGLFMADRFAKPANNEDDEHSIAVAATAAAATSTSATADTIGNVDIVDEESNNETDYEPLSDEEMDAELDQIEQEEDPGP